MQHRGDTPRQVGRLNVSGQIAFSHGPLEAFAERDDQCIAAPPFRVAGNRPFRRRPAPLNQEASARIAGVGDEFDALAEEPLDDPRAVGSSRASRLAAAGPST